jgi:hypothetical protein
MAVHSGILSSELWHRATTFISSAETLIGASRLDYPTYFLLSHALELTLKAYLAAKNVSEKDLRRKIKHDLTHAYAKANENGFRMDDERVPIAVQALAEFHSEYAFRYPTKKRWGFGYRWQRFSG